MNSEDKERGELPVESQFSKLPVISKTAQSEEEERGEGKNIKIPILKAIAVCFAIGALLAAFMLFVPKKQEIPPEQPQEPQTDESEAWRGAFAEEDIYRDCLEQTVTVRWGQGASAKIWTGVVLSEDGTIATSAEYLKNPRSGRIYVVLNDGREYMAESIRLFDESPCALLKIDAKELKSAELRAQDLHIGEELIAISASRDRGLVVKYEEPSAVTNELFALGVPLGETGVGAPIFDGEGKVAAFVCGTENGDMAISAGTANEFFSKASKK